MAEQVKVTITAQDQTKGGIQSVQGNLDSLEQSAEKMQGKAVAAFAALSVAIGGTVKISMDFEAAMDRVAAISQATGGEFETLKQTALAMGADTVYSATQAAGALTSLAQAGFNTEQQVAAIPGVLNMAAVEMMDLGQAADIGSSILAGFNLKAGEMGRVADILTAASVSTNVGISDLGESMKFLGPIASSVGMTLEQTVSAVGLLGNAGIKGGEAGRQLRGGLTALINPSAEAASVMKALGISIADQHGQFRGLTDILGQFQTATAGMSETQRAATVATVVGQESMSTFLALMQAGPEAVSALTKELENSGGAADRMATQQLDNLKGSLEEMKGQFEDAAIALGDSFKPNAEAAVAIITDLLTAISGVARESPGAVAGFGTLALMVSAATIAVTQLYRAFLALQAGMGPAGWIMIGIGVIVGALADLAITTRAANMEQQKQGETLITLSGHYDELTQAMNDAGASDAERAKATKDQKKAIEEIGAAFPELVKRWDEHGKAVELDTARLNENTQAAINNAAAQGRKDLGNLQTGAEDAYANLDQTNQKIKFEHDRLKQDFDRQVSLGVLTQAAADKFLDANLSKTNGMLQEATQAYDRAAAKVNQKTTELYGQTNGDFFEQPIVWNTPPPPTTTRTGTTGPVPGSNEAKVPKTPKTPKPANEMSEGLKADLEVLQDMQALERSPENMKAILAKTRQIIAAHYDELAKLDKLRDMQRTAMITLPNEIAQAEYSAALTHLDADKTLSNLTPEAFAQGLRGIKARFQAYLAAHPDQSLQMDLRLKGASAEELKAPLDRWKEALRTAEQVGGFDGTGGQDRKLMFLKRGLSLAAGAGDQQSVAELTGQIKAIEKALSNANFTEKFDRIKKAREQAFAGAAGALAGLQKELITEEAKGDKASPTAIAAIKRQVLDVARPAMEAEKAALEALRDSVLADTTMSEEERAKRVADIEQSLNRVRSDLYQDDVSAHRIATEAKVAAEKHAAAEKAKAEKKWNDERKALQKDALDALDKAEKAATEAFKAEAKAREDAIQGQIDAKEKQLKQFDEQITKEDRLKKLQDDQKRIDDLKHSGEQRTVIKADGSTEQRTVGMDDAKDQLANDKKEIERAQKREALQAQVEALRQQLQAEKDSNRDKEQALKDHFTAVKEAMQKSFEDMNADQAVGLDNMKTSLAGQVDDLLGEWARYAAEAKRIINSIPTAPEPPVITDTTGSGSGSGTVSTTSTTQAGHAAFASGADLPGGNPGMAVVNDVPEYYLPKTGVPLVARSMARDLMALIPRMLTMPTIPVGLAGGFGGGGGGPSLGDVNVNVTVPPNAAGSPAEIGDYVGRAVRANVAAAFQWGAAKGRTSR